MIELFYIGGNYCIYVKEGTRRMAKKGCTTPERHKNKKHQTLTEQVTPTA